MTTVPIRAANRAILPVLCRDPKVEHVFAHQKGLMGLAVRSIGIARARVIIGLVNLAYNIHRFVWLSGRAEPA